jgi:hypothetical protein
MDSISKSMVAEGDHFFEASGIRFHYRVGGHGPLLIANSVGWGMPGQYLWNGMGPHLEKEHTVIYFDPVATARQANPPTRPSSPARSWPRTSSTCARTSA